MQFRLYLYNLDPQVCTIIAGRIRPSVHPPVVSTSTARMSSVTYLLLVTLTLTLSPGLVSTILVSGVILLYCLR